jgi:hypothetical protein
MRATTLRHRAGRNGRHGAQDLDEAHQACRCQYDFREAQSERVHCETYNLHYR